MITITTPLPSQYKFEIPERRKAHDNWRWSEHEEYAKATSAISFGCKIGASGECQGWHRWKNYSGPVMNQVGCCCVGCAYHRGYLYSIEPGSTKRYLELWDAELGFWRPGKGCVLPRAMRSFVCLSYVCDDANRETKGRARKEVGEIQLEIDRRVRERWKRRNP